jgi:hypothetical protein
LPAPDSLRLKSSDATTSLTPGEIAQEYGVHPVLVGQWKKEILENAGALFDVKRGPKPVDESSPEDKLYSEIGKLKMQVDWLKKKLGE